MIFPNVIFQICDKENKNNSIFSFGFNELIDTFEHNDNQEYNYTFSSLIKTLCESETILNNYLKDYVIRITTALISHLQNFKSEANKCAPNYFIILKKFSLCDKEAFMNSLKRNFNNDQQIIFVIMKYLDFVNFQNYNKIENAIKNYNKSFIKDIGELKYAIEQKKVDFVSKYMKIVDGKGGINQGNNSREVNTFQISFFH